LKKFQNFKEVQVQAAAEVFHQAAVQVLAADLPAEAVQLQAGNIIQFLLTF
jgi:hypothetical protein